MAQDCDAAEALARDEAEVRYLANPLYAALLAIFFQYGVALHDLEAERIATGESSLREKRGLGQQIWRKVRGQTLKDYVLFPLLAGPSAPLVLAGNATANLTRNLWAFTIIFCGHFPAGTAQFTEEEAAQETRAQLTVQVTYKGMPLYSFAEDTQPGDAKGQGIKDVGTWSAVTVSSQSASGSSAPASSSSEPASSHGGY